jgi:FecR protein
MGQKSKRKDFTNARAHTINPPMNMERRCILVFAPVALAVASWLPKQLAAAELQEARVTQIVQDVKVVPPSAAARPAAVNETVRHGNAVQTGVQSRSELTFKDQTITRLGEKTSFTVGGEGRTVELGSGQFLLYVPKKSGGAKVKMGAVTAAITGTTILGNVAPSGLVEFTVLEGTATIQLERAGQCLRVQAGQKVTYDPVANRLEDPVDIDIQQQLSSPLVSGFQRLPSAPLIDQAIQNQRQTSAALANDDLARAVRSAGAGSIGTASSEQFLGAFNSLAVRRTPREICVLVARAVSARPDLADRIVAAALTATRPVRGYSREISCDWVECFIQAAITAHPSAARQITDAALAAAPMLRDCIVAAAAGPCPPQNAFLPPFVISPPNPSNSKPGPVSPEQPPTTSERR